MTIQTGLTQEQVDAIPEPKVVVTYDGVSTVYDGTDLDTPPVNPAQGD